MSQLFQVLRCYKCSVFQVHQVKKANKWACKMCGEKQSIKRHYGLGTGIECRLHVQKLNGIRGEVDELIQNKIDTDNDDEDENDELINKTVVESQKQSRWSNYIDKTEPPVDSSPMFLNNTKVVLELPQKRKRTFGNSHRYKTKNTAVSNENNVDDIQKSDEKEELLHVNTSRIKLEPGLSMEIPSTPIVNKEITKSKKFVVNKFKPPTVNKNSKWAQYTEESEVHEEEENFEPYEEIEKLMSQSVEQTQKKCDALFSLCDDDDLDNVLDL